MMHMRMTGGDEITGKAYDARLMRQLWNYVRPHQALALSALALLLVTSVADLAGPSLPCWLRRIRRSQNTAMTQAGT